MASAMGFFDRFLSSPEKRALAELAALAGSKEALIDRLRRHAAMCPYPTIKAGIDRIVEGQEESFNVLRGLLTERDTWPRPPEAALREGANNWERLTNDLEILRVVAVGMQKEAGVWEGIDLSVSQRLAEIAAADSAAEEDLRALALKCDPQALD